MTMWVRGGGSAGRSERCKLAYDEGIVVFFANSKALYKLKICLTRCLPSGIGDHLAFTGSALILTNHKGLFCPLILLLYPT